MKFNFKSVFAKVILVSIFTLALVVVTGGNKAEAAACNASAGDWNTVGTWSCGHVPTTGDTVTIPTAVAVTVLTTPATIPDSITFADPINAANSITISSGATLTTTGAVTLVASTGTGGETLSVGPGALVSGTIGITSGATAGSCVVNVTSGSVTSGNITVTGGATGTASIAVSTGSITSSGATGIVLAGTPARTQLTVSGSGTLTLSGATGTISASGTGTVSFNSASTVAFTGTGAQAVPVYTYGNMTINKASGTATLVGNTNIVQSLLISSGTFNTSTFDINITLNTTIQSGGTLIHGTGSKTHNGNVVINTGGTWTETGAAVVHFLGDITNNGTFTASTGVHNFDIDVRNIYGTFSIPNVTLNGSMTNNGTFTVSTALAGASILTNAAGATLNLGGTSTNILAVSASNNTVNYTGSAQTVVPTTYYNLTLSGSGVKTTTGVTTTGLYTIVMSGYSYTVVNGSTATSVNIGGSTITIVVPSGTFELRSPDKYLLPNNASVAQVCNLTGPYNSVVFTTAGTFIITPQTIVCSVSNGQNNVSSSGGRAANMIPVQASIAPINIVPSGVVITFAPPTVSMVYNFGTATLKNGSKGDAVKQLQMFLNQTLNLGLVVDGKLGAKTILVIKTWQKNHGLVADGLIGAKTKAMMNASVK